MNVDPNAPKRPALKYYGGKWRLAPWIISYFPEHKNYVEPCGGSGAVLIQKTPSNLETFNDLDSHIVNFFQVLRNSTDELIRRIELTPWSREEYMLTKTPDDDPIENARRFFMCSWMSISNMAFEKSTGWRSQSYAKKAIALLYNRSEISVCLHKIAQRFLTVQIENRDARYVIDRYGMRDDTLVYFDPPYLAETRVAKDQYLLEVDSSFHIECAELLYKSQGYVVVSGYASDLYKDLYESKEWQRVDKKARGNTGSQRVESLWLSPKTAKVINAPIQEGFL